MTTLGMVFSIIALVCGAIMAIAWIIMIASGKVNASSGNLAEAIRDLIYELK